MKLCRKKDNSETSTRADRQNASVVLTLFNLLYLLLLHYFKSRNRPTITKTHIFATVRAIDEHLGVIGIRWRFGALRHARIFVVDPRNSLNLNFRWTNAQWVETAWNWRVQAMDENLFPLFPLTNSADQRTYQSKVLRESDPPNVFCFAFLVPQEFHLKFLSLPSDLKCISSSNASRSLSWNAKSLPVSL